MSDAAQIVTAICGAITAIAVPLIGLLLARQNARQTEILKATAHKVEEVAVKAEEVKQAANGVKAELVAVTAKAAHAEGKAEGISEERERDKT